MPESQLDTQNLERDEIVVVNRGEPDVYTARTIETEAQSGNRYNLSTREAEYIDTGHQVRRHVLLDYTAGKRMHNDEITAVIKDARTASPSLKPGSIYGRKKAGTEVSYYVNLGLSEQDSLARLQQRAKENNLSYEDVLLAMDRDYAKADVVLTRRGQTLSERDAFIQAARARREQTDLDLEVRDNPKQELTTNIKNIAAACIAGANPEDIPVGSKYIATYDKNRAVLTIVHKDNRGLNSSGAKLEVSLNRYHGGNPEHIQVSGIQLVAGQGKEKVAFNFNTEVPEHTKMILAFTRPSVTKEELAGVGQEDEVETPEEDQDTPRNVPGISRATMDRMQAERNDPANIIARLASNPTIEAADRQELDRLQGILNGGRILIPMDLERLHEIQGRVETNSVQSEVSEQEEGEGNSFLKGIKALQDLLKSESKKRKDENRVLREEVDTLRIELAKQGELIQSLSGEVATLTTELAEARKTLEDATKGFTRALEQMRNANISPKAVGEGTSGEGPEAQEEPVPATPNPSNDSGSARAKVPKEEPEMDKDLANDVRQILEEAETKNPENTPELNKDAVVARAQQLMRNRFGRLRGDQLEELTHTIENLQQNEPNQETLVRASQYLDSLVAPEQESSSPRQVLIDDARRLLRNSGVLSTIDNTEDVQRLRNIVKGTFEDESLENNRAFIAGLEERVGVNTNSPTEQTETQAVPESTT